jgi:ppGpp synthetase/RelA/SpoT-type nucleotidyltranferase
MKLLTKKDTNLLLKSWDKRNDTLSSLTVWVKLFSISKNQRWYLIALNPQDEDEFYAICQTGDDITIDYYFLSTLSSKNAMGFSNVEREIYSFNPIKANEVFEGLLSKEYYAKGGEIEVKVLNQGEKFNQSKYKAIYSDSDEDGIPNIDDAEPFKYEKTPTQVEQVKLSEVFEKLLNTKEDLNNTMDDMVLELKTISPKNAKIYARTKTPYSILKKLIDKRLIVKGNPKLGLTDLVGTTITVENYNQLLKLKRLVSSGQIGEIIDFDDYYKNPNNGYRAFHYIIIDKVNKVPVEVQLKTFRMKAVNELSHDAYKEDRLDADRLLFVTDLIYKADRGDLKSKLEVDKLFSQPEKLKESLYIKT